MCLAVPGRIVEIAGSDELRSARVDFGGVTREISLVFTPQAELGDYVLVHVGFAISVIDEEVARDTLRALDELRLADDGGADDAAP